MAKMMTKSQIAGHIADKFEITKKTSVSILEELATLAAKQAKNGFVFPGVGKLVVVKRKARMGRNPQTGEPIKIPAKTGSSSDREYEGNWPSGRPPEFAPGVPGPRYPTPANQSRLWPGPVVASARGGVTGARRSPASLLVALTSASPAWRVATGGAARTMPVTPLPSTSRPPPISSYRSSPSGSTCSSAASVGGASA